MSFGEWYKENQSLDKESFEKELEIYKNDVIANLGMSSDKNAVYLVNAGRMNHGKSSLFNSFLGREEFQVKDVRTTVKNKEVKWKDNIILVDTPGLDAADEDTSKAYEAYYKADLIFFVHTVRTGELHESEIEAIKKISQNFSKDYFWKHFCLVLSFKESVDEASLDAITQESVNSIKIACAAEDFAVFSVSNSRYINGITNNKKGLIHHSGILELLDFIDCKVDEWYRESLDKNEDVLKDNLRKLHDEVCSVIDGKHNDDLGDGDKVDDLEKIATSFKVELEKIDAKYQKSNDKNRSIISEISELEAKKKKICILDDKREGIEEIDKKVKKLLAEQKKIINKQDSLIEEKRNKEDEAKRTCVKLGILDESNMFNFNLVIDNIANLHGKLSHRDDLDAKKIGGGKSIDELRDIVKTFQLEIEAFDIKWWKNQDKWRSIHDKISKLTHRNNEICAWFDKQDECDRNSREIDRLMAEQEKIDIEQENITEEKYDKEKEAQFTCAKLGILDEALTFDYELVMENIDKIASQIKNEDNKLDYVRGFCNELEKISKSDNLLLLVKNGEMSKHLRIFGVAAELSGDEDIKRDETIILDKIQKNNGIVAEDKELQDSLNNAYRRIYKITNDLRGAISREIEKIDKVIAGYMQEADKRIQKIRAVIDEDAFEKKFQELDFERAKAHDGLNKNVNNPTIFNRYERKFNELIELHNQLSIEYRTLLEKRTHMREKAAEYFRKCGVLNEADKFSKNSINEYIDKFKDSLYEENVNELQEKLRKLTNGLRSVKVIGELVGIKVTE